MNRILVTGSTGNVGRHVVDLLSAAGAQFRAMTRDPDAARLPAHVDVVRGDLTVPESLDSCLLLNAWSAALGRPAFVSPTFSELTGNAPRSFLEWATEYAAEFRA